MSESRQLAVIMFTDIVGYTAMMQQDESLALIQLNRYKNALKQKVAEYHGEIVQYFGDGGLVIFSNSADAVSCSGDLQNIFRETPTLPVRIGLHLGDIIYKEGNIFGDSVNITSRIESMGIAGAVLMSETVQKQLKNKPSFKFFSLGNFEFKNVNESMEIFALANDQFAVPNREEMHGKFKEQHAVKSVAVLPFVNMSNDPEQEYFSDGIADEIINSLTHLKDLNVAGRTSSFQFKGKNIDIREVGKKLDVQTVLEGSVRKHANRLRITAQLINVEDGYHLWSERYDRELNDVFEIQDEIALAITEKLRVTLLKKDRELMTKNHRQNTEAYELYLKGRFYLERRGTSLLISIQCFEKAIELDAEFALAHSGYADANMLLGTYGLLPPKLVMTKAKISAEKALQLDPNMSQAYCSLGYYYTSFEWNWKEGKKNFLKSIEINPRNAEGHYRYGMNYLACVEGEFDEAEKHGAIAIKLEPLSAICYANYAMILNIAGKYKESLAAAKTGIELDANSFLCHIITGRTQMALGQYREAIASFESAMKLTNRHHFTVNALIWTYCIIKYFDNARDLMNELKERSATEYIAKAYTGLSAAYLEDLGEAFNFLEQAFLDRDPILSMLKYEPGVPQTLKEDPRFEKLLKRIGFPD